MKELNTADPIATELKTPEKRKIQFIGAMRPRRGHKVFKFIDGEVLELLPSDYSEEVIDMTGKHKRKIIVEKGAKYTSALNKKNAIKQLLRAGMIVRKPSV